MCNENVLQPAWWILEEKVMLQALRLPTDLHQTVVSKKKKIIY
jgi:hypothetical protein